jgi:hypothetical protein
MRFNATLCAIKRKSFKEVMTRDALVGAPGRVP